MLRIALVYLTVAVFVGFFGFGMLAGVPAGLAKLTALLFLTLGVAEVIQRSAASA